MDTWSFRQFQRSLKRMGTTGKRTAVVVSIIVACVLAAALSPGTPTSHATLPRLVNKSANAIDTSIPSASAAKEQTRLRANEAYGNLPLSFEINQGQTDSRVKFISRGASYNLFLTSTEAVLSLDSNRGVGGDQRSTRTAKHVLRMNLVGANPTPQVEGSDELPGKSNYFIGNNPKNWRANISTFARVHYQDVYPGVDVVYYGNQRKLEND